MFLVDSVRCMVRQGRVVFPMVEQAQTASFNFWRSTGILKRGLLDAADVVSGSEFLTIEDVSEESLPPTTSLTHTVNAPEKYQQLGVDACTSVLKGCLGDLSSGCKKPVLVVDLVPHTADMIRAVVKEKFNGGMMGLQLYFAGFHADEVEAEWARHTAVDYVYTRLMSKEFTPVVPLPSETEDSSKVPVPEQPKLTTLGWSRVKINGLATLKTPEKLILQWHDHDTFGHDFQTFLAEMRKEHLLDRKEDETEQTKGKRQKTGKDAKGGEERQNPAPIPKAVEIPVISADEMVTPTKYEATCASVNIEAVISIGPRVYLVNRTSEELCVNKGTPLLGYYKGKFWSKKMSEDTEVQKSDVPFELSGHENFVSLNGKHCQLKDVIDSKRKVSPADAHVAYHKLTDTSPSPALISFQARCDTVHIISRFFQKAFFKRAFFRKPCSNIIV